MSYPILYSPTETDFETLGAGVLNDCISCKVCEAKHGKYILDLEYPVNGIHFEEIKYRSIIKALTHDGFQLFRVVKIHKPFRNVVSISAEHISYDLLGTVVDPFEATSVTDAMVQIKSHEVEKSKFEFWTDKSTVATMKHDEPMTEKSLLWGVKGSLLDVYGGEFRFDNYNVMLYNQRGTDNGVTIEYGKNLTDLTQDENCANVYTGVVGFWKDSESTDIVYTNPKIIKAEGTFDFSKNLTVDFTSDFQEKPTQEQLTARVRQYVKANKIGIPKVSLSVSYVQLQQAVGYEDLKFVEAVNLCDTVTVRFPKMGVYATAKAVEITYNSLLERVENVVLGETRPKITQSINNNTQSVEQIMKPSFIGSKLQQAVDKATGWITKGGGYIVPIKSADGYWKELLSVDNVDISQAKSVWRWNNGGFGHSNSGYNGKYRTAITQDGHIVADFIDTGVLNASIIKAGIATGHNNKFSIDFNSGKVRMDDADLTGKLTVKGLKYDLKVINETALTRTGESTLGMVRYDKQGKADSYIVFTDEDATVAQYGIRLESFDDSIVISSRKEYQGIRNEINWNGSYTIGVPDGEFKRNFVRVNNEGMDTDKGINTHANLDSGDLAIGLTHWRNRNRSERATFGLTPIQNTLGATVESYTGLTEKTRMSVYTANGGVSASIRMYSAQYESEKYISLGTLTFTADKLFYNGKEILTK